MAVPPDPIRHVTAKTRIYLPGGNHGFRPGESVQLPESVIKDLTAAGHLEAPKPEPVEHPADSVSEAAAPTPEAAPIASPAA